MDIYAKQMGATIGMAHPCGGVDGEMKQPAVVMLEAQISDNLALVQACAERAERLADRVCGVVPSDATVKSVTGPSGSNGLLDVLRSLERVMQNHLHAIDNALHRLDGDLG